MERAPRPATLVEKQLEKGGINEKIALWLEIINLSSLSPEAKTGFTELIEIFNQSTYHDIDDWVYYSIGRLANIYEKFKSEEEALVIFESIRNEMWDFWREVKDKI